MTREEEIRNYMTKLEINREEAEQLWQDDHDNVVTPEMAEMEKKAKKIKRYEKSDTPRKKTERTRKVDAEKYFLLNLLYNSLECDGLTLGAKKNEAEFNFNYHEQEYTVKLVKHRKSKEK